MSPRSAALAALTALTLAGQVAMAKEVREAGPVLDYLVTAGPGGTELTVEARLPSTGRGELAIPDGFEPFLDSAEIADGPAWRPLGRRGGVIAAPACAKGPCRVRYRVRLAEAAAALRSREQAVAHQGVLLSPPSGWLVRPWPGEPRGRFRMHVQTPPDVAFVSGVSRAPDGAPDTYEAAAENLLAAPYSAFGRLEVSRLDVAGATLEVALAPGEHAASTQEILGWVERSAAAVGGFYGRFPVPRAVVFVLPGASRRPIGFGSAMGGGGASIIMWMGSTATAADFRKDWALAHEMAHLGLPNVPRRHRWLEEGLATYVEPVARVRAGLTTPEEFWAEMGRGFPRGLLRPGEAGFDDAGRWGTTYWGGALYWFLADLEIRERTGNRRGVEDALRGIRDAGGSIAVSWPLERVLAQGDRAVGVPALQQMYNRLGRGTMEVDLPSLWQRLGVESTDDKVQFQEGAPLAAVRRALTTAREAAPGSKGGR